MQYFATIQPQLKYLPSNQTNLLVDNIIRNQARTNACGIYRLKKFSQKLWFDCILQKLDYYYENCMHRTVADKTSTFLNFHVLVV